MYNEKYAGFWKRFGAHIIDQIILGILHSIFIFPLLIYIFFNYFDLDDLGKHADYASYSFDSFEGLSLYYLILFILAVSVMALIIDWLYYALLESSLRQATLGKMVLSIKVTDLEGNRISFGKASGRYFGKILSGLFLMIGYIMAGITEKKQALHDILAGCLVVNTLFREENNIFNRGEINNETGI